MNKQDAIAKINKLSERKSPFLFIIDFKMKNCIVHDTDELKNKNILFSINSQNNFKSKRTPDKKLYFTSKPVSINRYSSAFRTVQKEISTGNSYLLNLTFPSEIKTNYTLRQLFNVSRAKYKLFYKNKFIVFSPESFIHIRNNIISSFPMKGTIDASEKNALKKILCDKKETAEHYTIVDLIRNDLSIVADNVKVNKFRYAEKIFTNNRELYQISSHISGKIKKEFRNDYGNLIFSLLPAGSISGAPKQKTLEIIGRVEQYNRGFYTGIFGFFDGKVLDSAVMIRYIESSGNSMIYKSGGGITFMSRQEDEYNELKSKIYVPVI